jgi:hypothetical protein
MTRRQAILAAILPMAALQSYFVQSGSVTFDSRTSYTLDLNNCKGLTIKKGRAEITFTTDEIWAELSKPWP